MCAQRSTPGFGCAIGSPDRSRCRIETIVRVPHGRRLYERDVPRAYDWDENPTQAYVGCLLAADDRFRSPAVQPWPREPPLLLGCSRSRCRSRMLGEECHDNSPSHSCDPFLGGARVKCGLGRAEHLSDRGHALRPCEGLWHLHPVQRRRQQDASHRHGRARGASVELSGLSERHPRSGADRWQSAAMSWSSFR